MITNILKKVKDNKYFIGILLLFLVIKFGSLHINLWYETSAWIRETLEFITINQQLNLIPHIPFSLIIYKIRLFLANWDLIWIRLINVFFSLWLFFLIYRFAKLLYGEKVALISIFIYTISFYGFVWSNIQIDQDSIINPFLFLLSIYLYKKNGVFSIKNILIVWLSIWLLTTSRILLWVIVLWILFFDIFLSRVKFNKKDFFNSFFSFVKGYLPIFLTSISLSIIFIYVFYLFFPILVSTELNQYVHMFSWLGQRWWGQLITKLAFLSQVIIYSTPIVFSFIYLMKDFKKHQITILSSIFMLLYMYMWLNGWEPSRRLMSVISFMVIWFSYIVYENFQVKHYIKSLVIWVSIWLIFLLLNTNLDYWNLPLGLSDFLSDPLNKIYILTTTTASPLYLHTKVLLIWLLLPIFWFLFALLSKKIVFIRLFLTTTVSFNIFLISLYMFKLWQPDISYISQELKSYCFENCKIWENIYSDIPSKDTIMVWFLEKEIWNVFSFELNKETDTKIKQMRQKLIKLESVNLFTKNLTDMEIIKKQIKENWSWYVFLTNYLWERFNNKLINLLNKECFLKKEFMWNQYINWTIYYCKQI